MAARIALRSFGVRYPSFTLTPLSLEFGAGERIALVGPNGSGKTTTLRALAGRLSEYDGAILFDGRDLRGLLPRGRRNIGLLPETLPGYGWMTVKEHLAFLREFIRDGIRTTRLTWWIVCGCRSENRSGDCRRAHA